VPRDRISKDHQGECKRSVELKKTAVSIITTYLSVLVKNNACVKKVKIAIFLIKTTIFKKQ